MNNPKLQIDPTKLTEEQRNRLEAYQHTQTQLRTLQDIADMVQELLHVVDAQKADNGKTSTNFGALLMDVRDSLTAMNGKEAPEPPDYAKPVVEAVSKLEKALTASIKAIDIKPVVDAPQVSITSPQVDLSAVATVLQKDIPNAFTKAIRLIDIPKVPAPDYKPLLDAWAGISEQLVSIENATRMKPLPGSMRISNLSEVTSSTTPVNVTVTSVGDTTTSTELIAANSNRKEVEFYNLSTATLYLLKGSGTASSTNLTVSLAQNDYYTSNAQTAFHGVWSADSGGTVLITESQ